MGFDLVAILHRFCDALRELGHEALPLRIFQHLSLILGHQAGDLDIEDLAGLETHLMIASFVMLNNVVVDLTYGFLDPRVHYR